MSEWCGVGGFSWLLEGESGLRSGSCSLSSGGLGVVVRDDDEEEGDDGREGKFGLKDDTSVGDT